MEQIQKHHRIQAARNGDNNALLIAEKLTGADIAIEGGLKTGALECWSTGVMS